MILVKIEAASELFWSETTRQSMALDLESPIEPPICLALSRYARMAKASSSTGECKDQSLAVTVIELIVHLRLNRTQKNASEEDNTYGRDPISYRQSTHSMTIFVGICLIVSLPRIPPEWVMLWITILVLLLLTIVLLGMQFFDHTS